jgi:precorrin-3B synthase
MASTSTLRPGRDRADRCPGVLRPWVAADGALLRIRLVGGRMTREQLAGLASLAQRFGDGSLYLTTRANLQVRGVALPVPDAVAAEVAALGLLPSPAHERVRNIMVSPLTGRLGGLADLRPAAGELDVALRADPLLASLPARFLFCLDDRGDLDDRAEDLGAVAVDPGRVRLRAGGLAGDVVDLADAPARLVDLARAFLARRGTGPTACWHVAELPGGGTELGPFRPAAGHPPAEQTPQPPPYGLLVQDDGRGARHLATDGGRLGPDLLDTVLSECGTEVVVTPWRSLLLPDLEAGS